MWILFRLSRPLFDELDLVCNGASLESQNGNKSILGIKISANAFNWVGAFVCVLSGLNIHSFGCGCACI